MSYRALQLRQQNKNTIAKLQTEWDQEKQILQQDIVNLENSADIKLLQQAQEKNKEIQKLLDNTINLLGSDDIKNLTDLKNLLQGQTLKELIATHQAERKESKKQVQTLTNQNEKLSKEKDSLVLEKNNWMKQLRTINVLFDPNAKNYETIEYSGLYSLLEKVAEKTKKQSWWGK